MKSRREFLQFGAIGSILGCSPLVLHSSGSRLFTMSTREEEFLNACSAGKTEIVKKLLSTDQKLLSAKDERWRSGFALALLAGHKMTAEYLKSSGYLTDLHESVLDLDWERFESLIGEESDQTEFLINADHPIGGCAMWAASAGGAGKEIWRVYAKCGDPNCSPRNNKGTTPLQKALRFPDLPTAEMTAATLLSNCADPNPESNAGLPPLHIAAERGSKTLVEMLIRLGAKVEQKDKNGLSAMQTAENNGHEDVWLLLRDHRQIPRTCRTSRSTYDAEGRTYTADDISQIPLYLRRRFVGSAHGNFDYIKNELSKDPRMVHSIATTSEKCVEASAHMGRKDIAEHLLKYGAPYSLPTAVMLNDLETVKKQLDEDPNRIHERGAHDFALLWYPVIGLCDPDMTQLLLDRGAKVEQQHFLGTTALHWACSRGPIELVELLVEKGADVNRKGRKFTAEGHTPLQMTKDDKIANYLRSKGATQ